MSKEEQQAIDVLKQVGFPKNEAKFLFYLFDKDKVFSRDIEINANLRQPEVSNAATWLTNKNLIKFVSTKKTGGKGRPLLKYSLAKSNGETLKVINDMFMARIHAMESNMNHFNKLFTTEKNKT